MPKRKSPDVLTTLQEGITWINQFATCKQLKNILGYHRSKWLKREELFYEWEHENSGPGMYLVYKYGLEKSKMATIKFKQILSVLSDKDREVEITVCNNHKLEYIVEPTTQGKLTPENTWIAWQLEENTTINSSPMCRLTMESEEDVNYSFNACYMNRVNINWSGTFLIAQHYLSALPEIVLCEIASFLF